MEVKYKRFVIGHIWTTSIVLKVVTGREGTHIVLPHRAGGELGDRIRIELQLDFTTGSVEAWTRNIVHGHEILHTPSWVSIFITSTQTFALLGVHEKGIGWSRLFVCLGRLILRGVGHDVETVVEKW